MTETKTFSATANVGAQGHRAFAVVVVAAGSGSRLGFGVPKAQVPVAEKSLLRWALEGVDAAGVASRLVVTVPAGDSELTATAREFGAAVVTGGASRADSVAAALAALSTAPVREGFSDTEPSAVLVHDCARCFTPGEVFANVCAALDDGEEAVIPVLPVVDTIKSVDAEDYVTGTPARSQLRAVQTPQGFNLATLLGAYEKAAQKGLAESITDDAMLAETLGIPVKTVPGSADAFKITTPLDLALAKALYEKEEK